MICSDWQLLCVWERGYSATRLQRAVLLATLAVPDASIDELIDLPIGYRDGCLMRLRHALFGNHAASTVACPNCHARLELNFAMEPLVNMTREYTEREFDIRCEAATVRVRYPSTRDLLQLKDRSEVEYERALLRRCIVEVNGLDDVRLEASSQHLLSELERRDALADVEYAMNCFECAHAFASPFDIVSFLWAELNAWCQRLLGDIHLLAQAYGWTETEILRLSSWRRQVYLNMVRQ